MFLRILQIVVLPGAKLLAEQHAYLKSTLLRAKNPKKPQSKLPEA